MKTLFNVVMLANQPQVQIYPIEVEIDQDDMWAMINGCKTGINKVLNRVMAIGNQDDRPHRKLFCSVSAGDIILLPSGRSYLVARFGFKELTVEEMATYMAMNQRDRLFCDLMQRD